MSTEPEGRRLGPKDKVSYLRVKMYSDNPHVVLFRNGKARAYHITGLFSMQKGLSECRKAFLEM